jgi:hypothetical protein
MGFVYMGNGAFARIDHIVRVRHIANSDKCEVTLSNNTLCLVRRDFLERSELPLTEVINGFASVEAANLPTGLSVREKPSARFTKSFLILGHAE